MHNVSPQLHIGTPDGTKGLTAIAAKCVLKGNFFCEIMGAKEVNEWSLLQSGLSTENWSGRSSCEPCTIGGESE